MRNLHSYRSLSIAAILACSALFPALTLGQSLGVAPAAKLSATDLFADFHLPPLKDTPDQTLLKQANSLQVLKRAHTLGLSSLDALAAWRRAGALLHQNEKAVESPRNAEVFNGAKASELNRLLLLPGISAVRVSGQSLTVDEPIQFMRGGIFLDLGTARLRASTKLAYALRIENVANVTILGGIVESGDSAFLISRASHVIIDGCRIRDLTGDGILVTHSEATVIRNNRITGLGGPGILIHGGSSSTLVEHNEITGNRGSSNMAAGIVISDREVNLADRAENLLGPDGYWVVSQPMAERLTIPENSVIAYNRVAGNQSSGIYVDGAVANVIALNSIEGNAKEGICFDNGATANVLALNDILENGSRWGESDAVMAKDSIASGGRLPDGTPATKVPGVSIDNAAYNLIFSNSVVHNFGGGIKIVRTGYFNVIGLNTVFANNDGASASFHFFGIELGAAALDAPSAELDGGPSRGNIVFSNTVRGPHYAGIFLAHGSDQNDIFDNVVMDAQHWALESVEPQANSSLNNLTNLPSRNIGSGLSPALMDSARAGK